MNEFVEHYRPEGTCYFYGGPFSNFVGSPGIVRSDQPWAEEPMTGRYDTVEHFFQACKAQTHEAHIYIGKAPDPGSSKVRGNKCDLRPDWEDVKYDYMLIGLRNKFDPVLNPQFFAELMATGDRLIAEDSPTDFIWGIRDAEGGFTGDNLLGKALMEVRTEFRDKGYDRD